MGWLRLVFVALPELFIQLPTSAYSCASAKLSERESILSEKPEFYIISQMQKTQKTTKNNNIFWIWATSWQNQQNNCAPSEDSDQPGHSPSLIRVFAVRMMKAWVLSYPLNAQRRLWSDWADAQADLSLRWAHTHFVYFVMSRLIYFFRLNGNNFIVFELNYQRLVCLFLYRT